MFKNHYQIEKAKQILNKAFDSHMNGELEKAIELYRKSIDIYPTAQAYTFLGWAFGMKNEFEDAIEQCKIAISLDPDYGNPYNDIGSYLIHQNRYDEAEKWLLAAIEAPNYDARHYPYFNLGKIYEKKGDWINAVKYYKQSYKINPEFESANKSAILLLSKMN